MRDLRPIKKNSGKKPSKILFYSTKYIQVIYRKMNSNNDLTDYILLLTLHQLILKNGTQFIRRVSIGLILGNIFLKENRSLKIVKSKYQ